MRKPLNSERLCKVCDPATFSFKTTSEIQLDPHIIGQPRGTQAIDFGINITSPGYNIYVL
jgi:hypothetical protein